MSHGTLQWIISAGNPGGGRKEFYCKPILNSQSGWWHDSRGELTIQPMKVPLKIFEAYRKWQIFQQNTNILIQCYIAFTLSEGWSLQYFTGWPRIGEGGKLSVAMSHLHERSHTDIYRGQPASLRNRGKRFSRVAMRRALALVESLK